MLYLPYLTFDKSNYYYIWEFYLCSLFVLHSKQPGKLWITILLIYNIYNMIISMDFTFKALKKWFLLFCYSLDNIIIIKFIFKFEQ